MSNNKHYQVIREFYITEFEEKIRLLLNDGWELYGNMSYRRYKDKSVGHLIYREIFLQALIFVGEPK